MSPSSSDVHDQSKGPKKKSVGEKPEDMPFVAYALADLGKKSSQVVFETFGQGKATLFAAQNEDELRELSEAFVEKKWSDSQAAIVLRALSDRILKEAKPIEILMLKRWIVAHPDDSQAVLDCLSVDPPEEMSIIRLLSRAGSQKLVFLARWHLVQREVVLKQLIAPAAEAAKILARERQAHPLSMSHSNIVKTHSVENALGETFLVEEYFPEVLNDKWLAPGVEEAANLLFDMADALTYLHEELLRVHGDIKPDNIGRAGGNYILLDFGIARPFSQVAEATATGSLRTRAPELLLERTDAIELPDRADVWALGATVFNTLKGRFPLLEPGEEVPRASDEPARSEMAKELARRARTEWSKWLEFEGVSEPLRGILVKALNRDPQHRPSAQELREDASNQLSVYIRGSKGSSMSPVAELEQYKRYLLPQSDRLDLLSPRTRKGLIERLTKLRDFDAFEPSQRRTVEELLSVLPPEPL